MGQVISYVKSFISNETDLNNNGVPDRDEIVKYVLEDLLISYYTHVIIMLYVKNVKFL